jgi:hypothetical protein
MTIQIQARKMVVVFPERYSLVEAHNIVKKWKPDETHYDIIDNKPVVYAKKETKIIANVTRLVNEGVRFHTGVIKIPHLTNPPLEKKEEPVKTDPVDRDIDENTTDWHRETEDVKGYLMGFIHGSMNRLEDEFTTMLRDSETSLKKDLEKQKETCEYNFYKSAEQISELRERIKILEQKL